MRDAPGARRDTRCPARRRWRTTDRRARISRTPRSTRTSKADRQDRGSGARAARRSPSHGARASSIGDGRDAEQDAKQQRQRASSRAARRESSTTIRDCSACRGGTSDGRIRRAARIVRRRPRTAPARSPYADPHDEHRRRSEWRRLCSDRAPYAGFGVDAPTSASPTHRNEIARDDRPADKRDRREAARHRGADATPNAAVLGHVGWSIHQAAANSASVVVAAAAMSVVASPACASTFGLATSSSVARRRPRPHTVVAPRARPPSARMRKNGSSPWRALASVST